SYSSESITNKIKKKITKARSTGSPSSKLRLPQGYARQPSLSTYVASEGWRRGELNRCDAPTKKHHFATIYTSYTKFTHCTDESPCLIRLTLAAALSQRIRRSK